MNQREMVMVVGHNLSPDNCVYCSLNIKHSLCQSSDIAEKGNCFLIYSNRILWLVSSCKGVRGRRRREILIRTSGMLPSLFLSCLQCRASFYFSLSLCLERAANLDIKPRLVGLLNKFANLPGKSAWSLFDCKRVAGVMMTTTTSVQACKMEFN